MYFISLLLLFIIIVILSILYKSVQIQLFNFKLIFFPSSLLQAGIPLRLEYVALFLQLIDTLVTTYWLFTSATVRSDRVEG